MHNLQESLLLIHLMENPMNPFLLRKEQSCVLSNELGSKSTQVAQEYFEHLKDKITPWQQRPLRLAA